MSSVYLATHQLLRERQVSCEWFAATEQEALWAVLAAERDVAAHDERVESYLQSGAPEPRALDQRSMKRRSRSVS